MDLGGGDWVEFKTALPYGERLAIEEELFKGVPPGTVEMRNGKATHVAEDGTRTEITLNNRGANLQLLLHAIVAWGGPGFTLPDGAVAEKTVQALDDLGYNAERILLHLKSRMVNQTPDFTRASSPQRNTAAGARRQKHGSRTSRSSSGPAGPRTNSSPSPKS